VRAYQTHRCGKFSGVNLNTANVGRGRQAERNPISIHARRVLRRQLKRGDRQRATQAEFRIEQEAELALQREHDEILAQFAEECREPTAEELAEIWLYPEPYGYLEDRYDAPYYDDYYE